jgi:hypothetical protein
MRASRQPPSQKPTEKHGERGEEYQTGVGKFFILIDEILQESFLRGNLVHGININLSKLLNVHRSAVLQKSASTQKGENATQRRTDLVVFMVVSGVVDCYEGIFSEDEALADFIDAEILAPLFALCEHDKGVLNIVLSCTQETALLTRQQTGQ